MRLSAVPLLCLWSVAALLGLAVAASAATGDMIPIVIDGTVAPERAAIIDGTVYLPLDVVGRIGGRLVWYDKAGRRVAIGPRPTEPVRPVLEVVQGEPSFRELVEGLGLSHRTSVDLPEKLEYYSCIILNNDNATSPKIVDRLRRFLAGGGGLVITGTTPALLVGENASSAPDHHWEPVDVRHIAEWLGCTTMVGTHYGSYEKPSWGGSRYPSGIVVNLGHPLGSQLYIAS